MDVHGILGHPFFPHRIHTINHHTGGEEPRLDLEFAYDDADPPLPENAKVRSQDFGNESGPSIFRAQIFDGRC